MAKVAPVKQTGGAGFRFEDLVGAYFAATILAGEDPAADLPFASRIDFQVGQRHFALDDLLYQLDDGTKLPISIKSADQFPHGRAPSDFVRDAWSELLGLSGSAFEPDRDLLGLVAPRPEARIERCLGELITWARTMDPQDIDTRLKERGAASQGHRALWESFKCPEELGVGGDTSPAAVLRRLCFIGLDLLQPSSTALVQALGWSKRALVDPTEADDLWMRVCSIVAARRPAGAMIDWSTLRDELSNFDLRGAIDYQPDRRALAEISRRNLQRVQDQIGGVVTIGRTAEIAELATAHQVHGAIALVGPSGCGKTVVAKQWTESRSDAEIIWLRAGDLEQIAGGSSPLRHELADVLAAAPRPSTFVIDGLDRRFDEAPFETAAALIDFARTDPRIRLILTSQEQEWTRVVETLHRLNAAVSWEVVPIGTFSVEQVNEVLAQMQPLRELAARSTLGGVLSRPKVLDAIASRLYQGSSSPHGELGSDEASVANWFWEHGLGTGPDSSRRAAFLLDLGERLGDRFESAANLQELDPTPVDDLCRDGICELDGARVSFAHDLYGDWIRYQVLLARGSDLGAYIRARIDSPVWHRSIRLYALGLLGSGGGDAWSEGMERIGGDSPGLLRDLFLDAPVFAADAGAAVESVWSTLVAGDGGLLSRFLSRFRHTASVPNPFLMAAFAAAEPDVAVYAAANNRVPLMPLWPAVLGALSAHGEEVVALADIELAQVVDLWLRGTPPDAPYREECAELAMAAARMIIDQSAGPRTYVSKEIRGNHLRAALASIRERPEEVEQLVRVFIDPAVDPDSVERSADSIAAEETVDFDPLADDDEAYVWLGAGTREGFRKLCLDTDALDPMIAVAPELAAELLWKLVIPPRPDRPRRPGAISDGFGVYGEFHWTSAIWIRGPYLKFLNANPEVGIRLIVTMANLASERYLEAQKAEFPEEVGGGIELRLPEGPTTWRGDEQVFVWYRGDSRCPATISSPLMALEKWLYDRIDQEQDIDAALGQILAESRSVALAGLLLSVGYKSPALFRDRLRPLLEVAALYHWEHRRIIQGNIQHRIGLFLEPELFRQMISQWHEMPHRSTEMERVTQTLFLTDAGFEEFMESVRSRWRGLNEDRDRHLLARLDSANWTLQKMSDGTEGWAYEHPADLRKESEEFAEEAGERHFWLQTPSRMRRAIDEGTHNDADDEELRQFWESTVARAEAPFPADLGEDGVIDPLDLRCGVAAFLVICHRDWLERSPEAQEWCLGTLLSGALTKPEPRWYDSEETSTNWGYESFCAQALPLLWAECPDDPEMRQAIAVLAANRHYDVIARLYMSAAGRRADLGTSFEELQALAVPVARFRTRRKVLSYSHDEDAAKENLATLEVALSAFHGETLDRQVPDFSLNAARPPSARRQGGRKRKSSARQPALDLHHIWSAWLWMPPFSEAADPAEHAAWLLFWQRMISAVMQRSEVGGGEDTEVSGPRFEYESVMLAALPARILELNDPAEAEILWRPLLARGAAGHSWIDRFLNSWVRTGLAAEPSSERFADRWEAMLRFAELNWKEPSYDGASNRMAILGMGNWLAEADWSERHAPLFARLVPFYERWAPEGLGDPRAVQAFLRLLRRRSCRPLVDAGLVWLERAAPLGPSGAGWDRIDDDLISTLSSLSAGIPGLARASSPGGKAFRALLGRAAARHDQVALALQEQLLGHGVGQPPGQ